MESCGATTRQTRAEKAAARYRKGRSRRAYKLRKDIQSGMASVQLPDVCPSCRGLLDLQDLYRGFVHSGPALCKRKAIYPKPGSATYQDVKKQNEFLLKTVFDGKGNYLYHRDCIRAVYGVGTQRLARLRKPIQDQVSKPVEYLPRQIVIQRQRQSDVVLPTHCVQASQKWLETQSDSALIPCRKQPTCHGNARKKSNHSKSGVVLQRFLDFVDKIQHQMDEKKGVMGKPSTLIASSHRFVLPTKMTLSMTTSASEVSYMNLTALSPWMDLARSLWVQCSTG